jgi:copper(I)-binding protein
VSGSGPRQRNGAFWARRARATVALAVLAGLVACVDAPESRGVDAAGDRQGEGSAVSVEGAFALDPLGGDRIAIYANLVNAGSSSDTLVSIASDVGGSSSLHEMALEQGIMRMRPVPAIVLPAGSSVRLEPGGLHGMLEGLGRIPAAGQEIRVTFHFSGTEPIEAVLPVRHPGDVQDGHAHH